MLPSLIVNLKSSPSFVQSQITEELKNLTTKGYEVYVKIMDRLALLSSDTENPKMTELKAFLNRDQLKFRSCVEKVQTALTDESASFYDVNDALFWVKKSLADTIDTWGLKLNEITIQTQQQLSNQSKKQEVVVDSGKLITEEVETMSENVTDNDENMANPNDERKYDEDVGLDIPNSGKAASVADGSIVSKEDVIHDKIKDNIDKKSILQIISQLIPSNSNSHSIIASPLPTNEYHSLPVGLFPVLVCDYDLSSIIAYTLVSPEYLREVDSINSGYISDSNNSPCLKRKSQDNLYDDEKENVTTNEKEKKSKQSCYITHQFQDPSSGTQFSCRIYFPKDFENLRFNFLSAPSNRDDERNIKTSRGDSDSDTSTKYDRKSSDSSLNQQNVRTLPDRSSQDIDNLRCSFARSLHRSVSWNARGGKSGSNFSKTIDDRFVLKEMTKQDVSIFEQFAPNYFDYLNQCLAQSQPTLLAKILGVFRITIKKKEYDNILNVYLSIQY